MIPKYSLCLAAFVAAGAIHAHAQGTAFAYQGRLDTAGVPANGTNDLSFTLFDAPTGGTRVGEINRFTALGISNGLFTVTLDFGPTAFLGSPRWLQIGVRPGSSAAAFTELAPRQPITATPNAIFAGYANTANAAGLAGTLPSTVLRGVNGSGLTSLTASNLTTGTVPDARLSTNVALRSGGNTFNGNQFVAGGKVGIGTVNPQAELDVNGVGSAKAMELRAVDSTPYLDFSSATNVDYNARILYGGKNDDALYYSASKQAFLGGNVGIGTANPVARLEVSNGSIGLQVIPGTLNGQANPNAVTLDMAGTKVLGIWDNLEVSGEITTTAINLTSDRNAKEGFRPVNVREVLDKVARLSITEWQYKTQTATRHMGPVAQDFHEAFALGHDEKHIASVDADGVALAAIQGLNEVVREKDAAIHQLREENESLARRLSAIEKALGIQSAHQVERAGSKR